MKMLEEDLREMFAGRVEAPPAVNDPAGRAIRRGRVIRRRQSVRSTVAAAMALVVIVGGVLASQGWWERTGPDRSTGAAFDIDPEPPTGTPVLPSHSTVDTGIGVDLRVGDRLWTADGRQFRLTGVGEVTRIYRVPGGWVYADVSKVRFLRDDGSSVSLSGEGDRWTLSPDGTRFAFALGSTLYVAQVSPAGMAVINSVEVPVDSWPVGFAGDKVIISDGPRGFGMVDLATGREPEWNTEVRAVYGPSGGVLAALVRRAGETRHCLALLRDSGTGLRVDSSGGCALGLAATPTGARLSPDGGWLAEWRDTAVLMIDIAGAVRGGTSAPVSCPADSTIEPVWSDARTLVAGTGERVVRCHVDGGREDVALPQGVGEGWQPVPRLTAGAGPD